MTEPAAAYLIRGDDGALVSEELTRLTTELAISVKYQPVQGATT